MTILTEGTWQRKQSDAKTKGLRDLRSKGKQDDEFEVQILAPFDVRGGGIESVPLAAATVDHDWKYGRKMEMVSLARKIISEAYFIGTLTDELPNAIAKAIHGSLPDDTRERVSLKEQRSKADIKAALLKSELNEWYTQFEKKYGKKLYKEMERLAGTDSRNWKLYTGQKGKQSVPLPYAMRNALDHNNPNNNWSIPELQTSIALLKEWVTQP